MPDVNLREGYLTSHKVASLWGNPAAERFYFHLLLAVDKEGRIENDPVILKNKCFPAIDGVSADDVAAWMQCCVSAGLVKSEDGGSLRLLKHEPAKKAAPRNCGGFKQWTLEEFAASVQSAVQENPEYAPFVREFTDYWTEPDADGRMRFAIQSTWRTAGRLATWRRFNDRSPLRGGANANSGGSYGRYTPHNG